MSDAPLADAVYRDIIMEEYKHPRNKGGLSGVTHSARSRNLSCGDDITVRLLVRDGVVADVRFEGVGCAISQAAASLFTERIKGLSVAEVEAMDERVITELFGFTPNPMRMKCAVLALRATAEALEKKDS
jgi:nitrogen fixation NifU-like protein